MSFRHRLALFFVLIVIVPMLAVTFLVFRLIADSEHGKANAAISARHDVAQRIFSEQRDLARAAIERDLSHDRVFVSALEKDDRRRASTRVRQLESSRGIERVVLVRDGRVAMRVGDRTAVAPAIRDVESSSHRSLGRIEVSVIDARSYARRVKRLTGLETVVRDGGKLLASTLPGIGSRTLPLNGDEISVGGRHYRAVSFTDGSSFTGQRLRVSTLRAIGGATSTKIRDGRITAASILLGFFLIAIACAVLVSRTLQQQIAGFLGAARLLAGGDFSAKVPTVGNDEFAELGEEFNKMSKELERRLAELGQERKRMQDSMLRLGEAVASGLDRDALLELVVRTAVDGVGADAGRASVRGPGATLQERSRVGGVNGLGTLLESAESQALRDGDQRETTDGEAQAIAHPLRDRASDEVLGVVSIGRRGKPFTPSDRELFRYLAGQAARSIENVQLHETATRESVTDELTGLSNRRAFDDALTAEVERGRRYGASLGLVLLDLDDFKSVNDTYGHQQGDIVLREAARVLGEASREIDHAARYGGEELAVVVPGTDLDGTYNLAERMRERIGALRIARLDGGGTISITASCGVAAVPPTAADERILLAAADTALYEAKRTGKNKSVRAR